MKEPMRRGSVHLAGSVPCRNTEEVWRLLSAKLGKNMIQTRKSRGALEEEIHYMRTVTKGHMIRRLCIVVAGAACAWVPASSLAQAFPAKPIRMTGCSSRRGYACNSEGERAADPPRKRVTHEHERDCNP